MNNRACFWKLFGSERVNESQKLLKSEGKYFDCTFSSLWVKLSQKKVFWIGPEILRLLDNRLTANYEYSRSKRENLPLQIHMNLSKKVNLLCDLFLYYWNRYSISNDLKKISLMGQVFLKLLTPKDVLI